MKIILTILLTLYFQFFFSQTIKELEYELTYYKSVETWGNKKDIAKKLLRIDPLNKIAINYLVEVYASKHQRDSIIELFEYLIKTNPNNPKPYLLLANERNARYAGLTTNQRVKYLIEAYKIDSTNVEALYSLGKSYYEFFNREFKKRKKKANLDYYSSKAIKYFSILCNQDERFKETLKFPLIQLANYRGNIRLKKLYESYNKQSSYFPISAFVDLPNDWQTNYSVNVLVYVSDSEFKVSGVESAVFHINWYASNLKACNEPVLWDTLPTKVFRFLWLRTFHHPIVIGLQNKNDTVTLYWKVCDGKGGYEHGKLIIDKSKTLTINEWNDFVASIDSIGFWNLPSTKYNILGNDGAQWILEGKEPGRYHVVDRWSGGVIITACLKLLEMTDLKIKKEDIY